MWLMNNKRLCGAADLFSKLPSSLLGRHVEMFDDVQKEECIRDKSIGNFWFQNLEIFTSKNIDHFIQAFLITLTSHTFRKWT